MSSSYDDERDYGYAEPAGGYDPRPASPATGSASGRASVGRVSVPTAITPQDAYGYHAGGYDDGSGYGGDAHYDEYGNPSYSGTRGGAAVSPPYGPVSPAGGAVGRASVGRAVVRPREDYDDLDDLDGDGGPDGPGGRGPGGRRPGGRGSAFTPAGKRKRTKRQKINRWVAIVAVGIMLAGVAVVGGVFFVDSVDIEQAALTSLDQATSIYWAQPDPKAKPVELARLGKVNRTLVTIQQIPVCMQEAIIAAEDMQFFTNSGVDVKGMVRAAWNNVTGGDRQGASTITQQYARKVADLNGITYSRKAREAVLAVKLSQKYSKEKILENYLNTADFGRNATGIEAAAHAYFNKSIKDIQPAEAMVLAALVKDPYGSDSFDPAENLQNSKDRWGYIQNNMRELVGSHPGFLTLDQINALKYPPLPKVDAKTLGSFGTEDGNPNGNIVNQVMLELKNRGVELGQGGYKIYTTIDQRAQAIAVKYAKRSAANNRKNAISPLDGQPANLTAALVAIDPRTGGVLAYYGGDHPTGTDLAGFNEGGTVTKDNPQGLFGGHPPGSSFKTYTLATALTAGIAYTSYWRSDSPRKDFASRDGRPVSNVGGESSSGPVTLDRAAQLSLNTVFYAVAEKIGADLDHTVGTGGHHIAETAAKAGVTFMWKDDGTGLPISNLAEKNYNEFGNEVAFGQYPVTVLDNAAGYATFANNGLHMPTHFVSKVIGPDGKPVPKAAPKLIGTKAVEPAVAADVSKVLGDVASHYNLSLSGYDFGVKTGTWQRGEGRLADENAHAWMVGYTPEISTAVWVGNPDGGYSKNLVYCKSTTTPVAKCSNLVYGATIPGSIWKKFMAEVLTTLKLPKTKFPASPNVGLAENGEIASPTPTTEPTKDPGPPGPGGGGPGGGPGGGGPGGGGTSPSPSPSTTTSGGGGNGHGLALGLAEPVMVVRPPD
jgi:membrane peptidoglycan carboxypeptidase